MIGFANLGDVNEHLVQFEKTLLEDVQPSPQLAKTMMVVMVRGLFNSLQFPYVQLPCGDLSGELLYDPFWEAVRRVENCGLMVTGAYCVLVLYISMRKFIHTGSWSDT